jgi:Ca-activated chloride channel family protein
MECPYGLHLSDKSKHSITMKKKIWILAALVLFSMGFSAPQSRTITGKVTSASDGSALPGVNVVLKGTKTGTVTDVKGGYSITVPASGGKLVFAFVGMNTLEVSIGSKSVINVQLTENVNSLQEVVVTGYATMKRKSMKDKAMGAPVQAVYAASRPSGTTVEHRRI